MRWSGDPKTCRACGIAKPRTEFRSLCKPKKPRAVKSHCRACEPALAKKWRDANRDKHLASLRKSQLKMHYGMTPDDFDRMLASQGGKCAICGCTDPGGVGRFHVDHNHETRAVRGLLCHLCNVGLGHFRDSAEVLARASSYLLEHHGGRS
jgi:hypothetical protein